MKALTSIFLLIFTQHLFAGDYVQSSRYTELSISAKNYQIDPLSVVINFTFPKEINKVGDALYLITEPSGYRFSLGDLDKAFILFEMPLPEVHKQLGPITLREAINVLAGKGFKPVVDDATRLISFKSTSASIDALDVSYYINEWERSHAGGVDASSIELVSKHEILEKPIDSDNNFISDYFDYVVIEGDSISKIASKFDITYSEYFVDSVLSFNEHAFVDGDPNLLMAGSKLQVPKL